MMDRKDLAMRNQRSFSLKFKKQVAEELLSGESQPVPLPSSHTAKNSAISLLFTWWILNGRGSINSSLHRTITNCPGFASWAISGHLSRIIWLLNMFRPRVRKKLGRIRSLLMVSAQTCFKLAPLLLPPLGFWVRGASPLLP